MKISIKLGVFIDRLFERGHGGGGGGGGWGLMVGRVGATAQWEGCGINGRVNSGDVFNLKEPPFTP